MSTTAQGRTPTLTAVICGAVVLAALLAFGMSWLISLLAGLVTISVVFTFRKRTAAQPEARQPDPVRAPLAPVAKAAPEPAPLARAEPEAAPAPVPAEEPERSFPDIRVVGAAAPTPEPAPAPSVASSQLPGEMELADRKGGWRYEAPAPLEDIAKVAKVAVQQALVGSSQLDGEVELAGRKGKWVYSG